MGRQPTKPETVEVRRLAGERLALLREVYEMTQKEAGAVVGVTQDFWSKLERGERPMEDSLAMDIARRFRVTLDWLYGGLAESSVAPELRATLVLLRPDLTVRLGKAKGTQNKATATRKGAAVSA